MYAAHVLWGIDQVLMLENWLAGWSLLVMTAPIMLFRMVVEERMMIGHHVNLAREPAAWGRAADRLLRCIRECRTQCSPQDHSK